MKEGESNHTDNICSLGYANGRLYTGRANAAGLYPKYNFVETMAIDTVH